MALSERQIEEIGTELFRWAADEDARQKAADERANAIIKAIEDAGKRQAEALERGLRGIADALRDRR